MKLSVHDLNSHYGPAHILFDIALEVGEGEVVAFPKGIVGVLETIRDRRRPPSAKPALLASGIETAE